jgi:hypothetical protein
MWRELMVEVKEMPFNEKIVGINDGTKHLQLRTKREKSIVSLAKRQYPK